MQPPARHCAPCAAPCSRPCVPIPPCRSAYVVSMTLDCPLSRLESRRAMRARDDSGKLRGLRRVKEKTRSEEHTSELQSPDHLVCRLLLEKKKQYMTHLSADVATL